MKFKKDTLVMVAARTVEDVEDYDDACLLRAKSEDDYDDETFWADTQDVYPFECGTYHDGFMTAWEVAMKIKSSPSEGGFTSSELYEMFGERNIDEILKMFTPRQIARKFEIWQHTSKLHACDVVWCDLDHKGIILTVLANNRYSILRDDGVIFISEKEAKHFPRAGSVMDIKDFSSRIGGDKEVKKITEQWEKVFHVGDIVRIHPLDKGVVTKVDDRTCYVLWNTGACEHVNSSVLTKIGELDSTEDFLDEIDGVEWYT